MLLVSKAKFSIYMFSIKLQKVNKLVNLFVILDLKNVWIDGKIHSKILLLIAQNLIFAFAKKIFFDKVY